MGRHNMSAQPGMVRIVIRTNTRLTKQACTRQEVLGCRYKSVQKNGMFRRVWLYRIGLHVSHHGRLRQ